MIWLPFLPGFLLWKLAIGSLFQHLVRKPVVFTGLEKVWSTVDTVGIPTFGLDGTGSTRPPTLAPAPEGSGILEETDMVGLPTDTKGLDTDPSQKQS
jgi:hypothetical protein